MSRQRTGTTTEPTEGVGERKVKSNLLSRSAQPQLSSRNVRRHLREEAALAARHVGRRRRPQRQPADARDFLTGDLVFVRGLTKQPQFNGRKGVVIDASAGVAENAGRLPVEVTLLAGEKKRMKLKPENLIHR